eukprot:UN08190
MNNLSLQTQVLNDEATHNDVFFSFNTQPSIIPRSYLYSQEDQRAEGSGTSACTGLVDTNPYTWTWVPTDSDGDGEATDEAEHEFNQKSPQRLAKQQCELTNSSSSNSKLEKD